MPAVQSYISFYSELWEESPADFPVFPCAYSPEEKRIREARFERIQEKMKSLQTNRNRQSLKEGDPGKTFFPVFREMMQSIFDFDAEQLEIILSEGFKNVSKDFFYQARKFGPDLSPENIYQGLRNVWIMNGIQLMMGIPVEITPSVFAYSMIYPYSDNLLDDPSRTRVEKHEFSRRFNSRLHGEKTSPEGFTEQQLFRLVGMIEQQFPRPDYPGVYESLYAIQQGQTRSLQLTGCNGPEDAVVREICFEKGGTSVLADGYLVAGRLTPEQEKALTGYGIYLQLLDDIQDRKEDTLADTKTLFACRNNQGNPESGVNRTVHFGRKALEELRCFRGTDMEAMLRLMNRSIESMMIESVGLNPDGYAADWLHHLEKHSPLGFEFLREKKLKSNSQRVELFKKYFDQVPC